MSAPAPVKKQIVPVKAATYDLLAKEMGISQALLREQIKSLSHWIHSGYIGTAGKLKCRLKYWKSLCSVFNQYSDYMNNSGSGSSRRRGARIRVSYATKKVHAFQKIPYRQLERRFPDIRNRRSLQRFVKKAVSKKGCPAEFSAFLLFQAENFFPAKWAFKALDELYLHTRHCIGKNHDASEEIHLKLGLLAYMRGMYKRALDSFERAIASEKKSEEFRSLFWAGKALRKLKKSNSLPVDHFWKELVKKYPLSYYAVLVQHKRGYDPFLKYKYNKPKVDVKRRSELVPEMNVALAYLEALFVEKKIKAFKKWAFWVARKSKGFEPGLILYLARLKQEAGDYHSNISIMFRLLRKNPELICEDTLRLYFPKPYFKLFDTLTPHLDTFLIMSLARQESSFNPKVVSSANARGLLQVRPSTARWVERGSERWLFDVEANTEIGVRYFTKIMKRYRFDVEKSLAAYNAGPHRVRKWIRRYKTDDKLLFNDLIPFRETRDYVSMILRNNYWYRCLYWKKYKPGKKQIQSPLISDLL